jgi:hypothetical protein
VIGAGMQTSAFSLPLWRLSGLLRAATYGSSF